MPNAETKTLKSANLWSLPNAPLKIVNRAIQAFGGAGVSGDFPGKILDGSARFAPRRWIQ
jgi:hypothetical protein